MYSTCVSPSRARYVTGVTYSLPVFRPRWCTRAMGLPSCGGPTRPSCARKTADDLFVQVVGICHHVLKDGCDLATKTAQAVSSPLGLRRAPIVPSQRGAPKAGKTPPRISSSSAISSMSTFPMSTGGTEHVDKQRLKRALALVRRHAYGTSTMMLSMPTALAIASIEARPSTRPSLSPSTIRNT